MNVEDLEIDKVSPDEDDRAAERLIRNHWHTGERFVIDQATHKSPHRFGISEHSFSFPNTNVPAPPVGKW